MGGPGGRKMAKTGGAFLMPVLPTQTFGRLLRHLFTAYPGASLAQHSLYKGTYMPWVASVLDAHAWCA